MLLLSFQFQKLWHLWHCFIFPLIDMPDNKVSNGIERQGTGERDVEDSIR